MAQITLEIADLDRTAHALLLAKSDFVSKCVLQLSGERWQEAMRNIGALDCLYAQFVIALGWKEIDADAPAPGHLHATDEAPSGDSRDT